MIISEYVLKCQGQLSRVPENTPVPTFTPVVYGSLSRYPGLPQV